MIELTIPANDVCKVSTEDTMPDTSDACVGRPLPSAELNSSVPKDTRLSTVLKNSGRLEVVGVGISEIGIG